MRYFLSTIALLLALNVSGRANDISPIVRIDAQESLRAFSELFTTDRVNFTLRNNRPVSIPLIIPGIMNPNLSPFSKSGVELVYGQEILFLEKGKRYILLVVDEQIAEGEVIDVGKLLKQRRKEEGLR